MKLINKTKLGYVDDFITKFGPLLQSFETSNTCQFYEKDHKCFENMDFEATPFIYIFSHIGINESLCSQIGLNNEEKWSLLLHEIGHIVRPIDQRDMDNETFFLQKELSADSFAVDNGFCEKLVSALDKLLLIKKLTQVQEDGIKKRISHWKNILNIKRTT